eukprot:scaffold63892_cov75-Phaeocystis_antarctica.AAC.5
MAALVIAVNAFSGGSVTSPNFSRTKSRTKFSWLNTASTPTPIATGLSRMFALVFQKASGLVVGLYFSSMAGCTGARPVQLERITGTVGLRSALTAARQRQSVERRMFVASRLARAAGRHRAEGCLGLRFD